MRRAWWATLGVGATISAGSTMRVLWHRLRRAERAASDAQAHHRALRAVVEAAGTATIADVQGVLDTVTRATAQLGSDMAGLFRTGDDGLLRFASTHRVPEHLQSTTLAPDEGLVGRVVTGNELVVINDYSTYDHGMSQFQAASLHAAIGAPIVVDGRVVGALVAARMQPGGYEEAEVVAFELLAAHAGRALTLAEVIDEDRRALAQLRRLHELQADFVATISHELRTPLTIIDGLAETLDRLGDRLDDEGRQQLFARLRANTTALTAIVTSLLESARLDRGLVEVDRAIVDLGTIAAQTADRLGPLLADHEVTVSTAAAPVLGDETLLGRVLENLLANAARHTPPGTHITLTVLAANGTCAVEVADDGPGIPPEDLEHVTERFRRGGDHHTRAARGLGLGLALADEVLRLHGTRLMISSETGVGSVFGFLLPLVDSGWGSSQVPTVAHGVGSSRNV